MKKTLAYIGFGLSVIVVIATFVTAKTYIQLVIAIIFYPLLAYFALKLFPRGNQIATAAPVMVSQPVAPTYNSPAPINFGDKKVEIVDIDKRTFLKLIGTAGITFFLFSILGRKVNELVFGQALQSQFGNSENLTNNQTVTNESQITEGYRISEIDDDIVSYYGFTNKEGNWLIMKEDSDNNTFRYAKGSSEFSKYWNSRKTLKYDYYYNLFSN